MFGAIAIACALEVLYARRLIEALGAAHGELVRALADR
jgi:hypothetical protein